MILYVFSLFKVLSFLWNCIWGRNTNLKILYWEISYLYWMNILYTNRFFFVLCLLSILTINCFQINWDICRFTYFVLLFYQYNQTYTYARAQIFIHTRACADIYTRTRTQENIFHHLNWRFWDARKLEILRAFALSLLKIY